MAFEGRIICVAFTRIAVSATTGRKAPMHIVSIENWSLSIEDGSLPSLYSSYVAHARFVDEIGIKEDSGKILFVGITPPSSSWPEIIVCQRYSPSDGGFSPGILLVPETCTLFIGAGERIVGYDIRARQKLWEEPIDCGFWGWEKVGEHVLLVAEMEFGVWTSSGERLWSTYVEPPWDFHVNGNVIELNVMEKKRRLRISDGSSV